MQTKHNFRKILLIYIIVIIIFITSATSITFYSLGYQLNFKTLELEKTGILRIEPIQKTYSIFLDNKQIDENEIAKTTQIPNLRPGNYNLKITSENYFDWKKNIAISPNQITNIYNILLLPKTNKTQEVSYINQATVNKKYSLIAFSSNDNLQILNYLSEKIQTANNIKINNSSQIFWINDELLAITNSNPEETLIQILNPFNNNTLEHKIPHSINASDILGTIPLNENILMYFHDNTIYTSDTLNSLPPQTLIENIYNPIIHNNILYYLPSENSNTLYAQNLTLKNTNKISLPTKTSSFFPVKNSDNLFVIQDNEQSYIYNYIASETTFYTSKISYAEQSYDKKRILLTNDKEILIAENKNNKYLINTILRLSSNIINAHFIDDDNIIYGSTFQLSRIDRSGDNHNIIEEEDHQNHQILLANKEKILTISRINDQNLLKYIIFDNK